jgi:hypothetical protein
MEKHSGLGIVSFCISVAVGGLILVTFIVASLLNRGSVEHGHSYPGQQLVGFAVIDLLAADILAVALGIASLCQAGKKRIFGILGLAVSASTILGTVALIIIGLLYVSRFAR